MKSLMDISISKESRPAKYYYGLYKFKQDDITIAEGYFNEVISGGKKDIVSEYDLSEIYSSSLPYGYSREKIIGKSHYQLGLIAARKNNLADALTHFKNAVQYLPDDSDALANLALAYDQHGDYNYAVRYFDKAISIDNTSALYYFNYAMTLGKIGDYTKATFNLEKAVELKPDFDQARQVLEALRKQLK